MDIDLEKKINEALEQVRQMSPNAIDYQQMDPVAKMMLVALIHEAQKIRDHAERMADRVMERYCENFIPRRKVEAMPALAIVAPQFKPRQEMAALPVSSSMTLSFKAPESRTPINYVPVLRNFLVPVQQVYTLTQHRLSYQGGSHQVSMEHPECVWIGISTRAEIDTLRGFSLLIKGTGGIAPSHICVGTESRELSFVTMQRMEDVEMLEPFDAQQASGDFFEFVEEWKQQMLDLPDTTLLYITDGVTDRDLFKPRAYPRLFQHWLESEVLDCFDDSILWLRLDFPEGFSAPDSLEVVPNAMPVVNIDVCTLTLTQAQPIAKLQKQEGAFFLRVLETSSAANKQGFGLTADEIIVRDFDAACYHDGDLYRDVRNLYNRFIEDYYAFIEYNGIKDGELIKQLRECINRIGKSVGTTNSKYRFDSGTYAMKNMNQYPPTTTTRVSYITTQGRAGNKPKIGQTMENKKMPGVDKDVPIIVSAMGGADKASADERNELLRYFTLTADRLYTRMDVDAFLRKEIIAEFGREEFKRIFIRISVQGSPGENGLQRGLYADIEFKDRKNYDHALQTAFHLRMRQRILNKSCIPMPVFVSLHNLETII